MVLVGNTVAQNLFPGQDPTGSVIRIKRVPFKVAGVLQAKGYSMGGYGPGRPGLLFRWPPPGKGYWADGR